MHVLLQTFGIYRGLERKTYDTPFLASPRTQKEGRNINTSSFISDLTYMQHLSGYPWNLIQGR
jgi:hypothetical protein